MLFTASIETTMSEHVASAYARHYQHGGGSGSIEVYRPYRRWQNGDGFGDTVRTALRYIIPAVAGGAEKFGTEILDRTEKGEKLGEAASKAIFPALMAAKDRALQRLEQNVQGGSGRKRGKKKHKGGLYHAFHDEEDWHSGKAHHKRVYKGRKGAGRKYKKAKRSVNVGTEDDEVNF